MPTTQEDTNARGIITAQLHEWGLDALGDWAWQRYKDTGSLDLVKLEMEDHKEYKQRFAGRLALREKGFQMTEAEQMAYETQARGLMQAAGMPPGFYDSWQDFTDVIAGGVSVSELSQRVNEAFARVTQAPPEVRRAMGEYYGAYSDSAIAALALDAKKAAPVIMNHVAATEAGGYLHQQKVNINRVLAERIARANANQTAAIQQGAQEIGAQKAAGLYDRLWGDADQITAMTGIQASLLHNQEAARRIQEQTDTRAAAGQGADHFDTSRAGATGLGTAQK